MSSTSALAGIEGPERVRIDWDDDDRATDDDDAGDSMSDAVAEALQEAAP
jgi:hypothetical protein